MKKNYSYSAGGSSPALLKMLLPYALIAIAIVYFGKPLKDLLSKTFNGISEGAGKLTDSLGITTSTATTNVQANIISNDSPLSPNLWLKGGSQTVLVTYNEVVRRLDLISSSFGYFGDNFGQVLAQFQLCRTQSQSSYMAHVWRTKNGNDLLNYLRGSAWPNDRLSDSEINEIINYLQSLPKFYL